MSFEEGDEQNFVFVHCTTIQFYKYLIINKNKIRSEVKAILRVAMS